MPLDLSHAAVVPTPIRAAPPTALRAQRAGIAMNLPSGPGKHTVERLTLTADRTRLRYEVTVEIASEP